MMTIGARRGDWLRRVRAEMRGPQEDAAPILVHFAATDARATSRRLLDVPPLETLATPASLVPSSIDSIMSTLHYAH